MHHSSTVGVAIACRWSEKFRALCVQFGGFYLAYIENWKRTHYNKVNCSMDSSGKYQTYGTDEEFVKKRENGDKPPGEPHQESLDEAPKTASKAFEVILHMVGDYNYYQWKLMFITGFCGLFTSLHNIGAAILAATPNHWCEVPFFKENGLAVDKTQMNFTTPWVRGKTGEMEHSKCTYYDYDYGSLLRNGFHVSDQSFVSDSNESLTSFLESGVAGNLTHCQSWTYDQSVFTSTIVSEWDLVCGKRWLMSSIQASYMMGILTGAVIFSAVSDKMGRRVSSLICCLLFFTASVSASFTTSFGMLLTLRFIVAAAGQGMFLVNFILLMETVSLHGRNVLGNLFHIFFSIGFTVLSLLGYLIRDWRNLQLAISIPTVVLLGYYWLLPESPRWLLMQKREKEGLELLKKISQANGKTFPSDEELKPYLNIIAKEIENEPTLSMKEKIKSVLHNVVSLVKTPIMRRRNLIIFYAWFVTSMVYYGLSFSGANLSASAYLSLALSGIIEIPATFTAILFTFKYGRRLILCLSFLIGGLACISIAFVPTEMVSWNLVLASIGKYNLTSCFLLVFIFSAELVPTQVRNISIGMASMCARIGSGLAPYIVDLLGDIYYAIPSTIFGALAVLAAALSMLLPETGKKRLPESISEIEAMKR